MPTLNQQEIIIQYLGMETNYAIVLYGEYGIGKTHFYKNTLSTRIKETPTLTDNSKYYTPIHISLFGIKSIEDIQSAIFMELYPILKNDKLKLASSMGKTITRGILNVVGAGNIDDYINDFKDIREKAEENLNFKNLVLCFDDIDRKSDQLNLNELFGFINSLVENDGAKILLIGNEKELEKDETSFATIAEKVIGVKIQYTPDIALICKEIIDQKYKNIWSVYHDFLSQEIQTIVDIVKINNNNLRSLNFFLEHFKLIYDHLENCFQTDKALNVFKDEKLKAILNFSLAISFEYKMGTLNHTNFDQFRVRELYITNNQSISSILSTSPSKSLSDKPENLTYLQKFARKYFETHRYHYFKSIFDYIIGIKPFIVGDLKSELESIFKTEDGKESEQYKVLRQLDYWDCINLSDSDYKKLTRNLLSYVDKGSFQLIEYARVFHFVTRFDNLLNYDLEKLINRFKKGIKKGSNHYTFIENLDWRMSYHHDVEFNEELKKIVKFCCDINEQVKLKSDIAEINTLFDLAQSDFHNFLETISDHGHKGHYTAIWDKIGDNNVIKLLKSLNNKQVWEIGTYFLKRYNTTMFPELLIEKTFVIELRNSIDLKCKTKSLLRKEAFTRLSNILLEAESNFPKTML